MGAVNAKKGKKNGSKLNNEVLDDEKAQFSVIDNSQLILSVLEFVSNVDTIVSAYFGLKIWCSLNDLFIPREIYNKILLDMIVPTKARKSTGYIGVNMNAIYSNIYKVSVIGDRKGML